MNRILLILFLFAARILYAGNPSKVTEFIHPKEWSFVENKGQLTDENGKSISDVKYYSHEGGANLYCRPGKISFVFTKTEHEENISEATGQPVETQCLRLNRAPAMPQPPLPQDAFNASIQRPITTNRVDLVLIGCNPSSEIIASDKQAYYENYYTANAPEKGITDVHTYKTITYKSVYPNIDMVLHAQPSGMKYEFVVYPGGNVRDIQMQWDGLEGIKKIKDSKIEYSLASGSLTESAPFTYQCASNVGAGLAPAQSMNNPQNKIASHFILKNYRISFRVGKYDKKEKLVIDPSLIWGTYYGDSGQTIIENLCTDPSGNVLITGYTSSPNGIATSGAFRTYLGGPGDGFLAKFNNAGIRLWGTYFLENATSGVSTDKAGSIYVTGETNMDSGLATFGAYQTSYSGQGDAYLAKFSGSGALTWATYFGGEGQDFGVSVSVDANGNAYLTGGTGSKNRIATSGAYESTHAGTSSAISEAFLAKFGSSGNLIWATYYGESGFDYANGVSVDSSGNAYITGWAEKGGIITTSGAYQTAFGGGSYNAFLAKFSNAGNLVWGTYFGGNGYDRANGISMDVNGDVYIVGVSQSITGVATSGAYQTSLTGGEDAFLAKFKSSGSLIWATYYGGNNDDYGMAVCSDTIGNTYITGPTLSNTGIVTPGSYQTFLGGAEDVFLAKFSSTGKKLWATYYGGNGQEIGFGLCSDKIGNVYIAGQTESTSGIATSGAFQTTFGGIEDAFLAKFNIKTNAADISLTGFSHPNDSICPGLISPIIVLLKNNGPDTIYSASIYWTVNGGDTNIIQFGGSAILPGKTTTENLSVFQGNYHFIRDNDTIIAWAIPHLAIDTVPGNDTAKMIIHFYSQHFAGAGQSSYSICTGTHIRIGTNGFPGNTYSWKSVPPGFISTISNPIVNPDSFTTFYLKETNTRTGCTNIDSSIVNVKVVKAPVANAGKSHTICFGDSTFIGSSTVSGISYLWSSYPTGFTSTLSSAIVKPNISTIYTVQVTNTTGCTDINTDTITVNHIQAITGPAQSVCSGSVVHLGAAPIPGHTYSWTSKPTGFTSTLSDPIDTPNVTTMYYFTATITGMGCTSSDSVLVTVLPRPVVKIQTDSIDVFTWKFSAVNPNYPANIYHWYINDSDSATGYNTIVTFKNKGTYTVKLIVSIPGFCSGSDSASININPKFSLNIFPNPFYNQATIRYVLDHSSHIKIVVLDMLGKDISTLVNEQLDPGEYNTPFYAGTLKTRQAMYLIVFMMDDKVITKKVVQVGSIYN